MLVINRAYAVLYQYCVTIAMLVIPLYEILLILIIFLWSELLALKERAELSRLMQFLQCSFPYQTALQTGLCHLVITHDGNVTHLGFLFLIYLNIKYDIVLLRYIVALQNIYLCILEALVLKVSLSQGLRS